MSEGKGICVRIALIAALIISCADAQPTQAEKSALLGRHLGPTTSARIVPLTEAFTRIGGAMRDHFVVFGIELASADGLVEPAVTPNIGPGTTVGQAVATVLDQVPHYTYEVVSTHLISVYPSAAKQDPNSVLNTVISRFDVEGIRAGDILPAPFLYIPELRKRLFPPTEGKQQIFTYVGAGGVGPKVTLHLQNVTVREILNAVAIATEKGGEGQAPLGWIYRPIRTGWKAPRWGLFYSLPPNWKDLLEPPSSFAP